MKVKIVKCSGKDYWYKDHIGKIFEVDEKYQGDAFCVKWDASCLIYNDDCEIQEDNMDTLKDKFTEEEFEVIIKFVMDGMGQNSAGIVYGKIDLINIAKEKGWIKKSAKEEAEFIAVELERNRLVNLDIANVLEMIKFYRQAIKEAEEK